MDKLFTASSPFSQANYSPLRNPHEQDQDDDDPTSRPPHRSPAHLHHHHANPQPQQFRHRSHSQSSSRAAIAYSSPDHPTGSFSEGEHDSDSETPLTPFNNTSNSNKRISSGSTRNSPSMDRGGGISSGAARRISGLRPQSLGSTGTTGIMLQGETIIAVNNTPASMTGGILPSSAIDSSSSSDDEPSSPPPKYTAEDLEYSEPARPSRHYSRDEEVGLGFRGLEDDQGDGLLMQVTTKKKWHRHSVKRSCKRERGRSRIQKWRLGLVFVYFCSLFCSFCSYGCCFLFAGKGEMTIAISNYNSLKGIEGRNVRWERGLDRKDRLHRTKDRTRREAGQDEACGSNWTGRKSGISITTLSARRRRWIHRGTQSRTPATTTTRNDGMMFTKEVKIEKSQYACCLDEQSNSRLSETITDQSSWRFGSTRFRKVEPTTKTKGETQGVQGIQGTWQIIDLFEV